MTVTLVYDATLSRVRVTATGLGTAVLATVQRSTDQVRWTTVRGGQDVSAAAGVLSAPVDDYEFASGLNYYRVSHRATITLVNVGTAAHADNASVVPGMPASVAVGDTLLCRAVCRDFAAIPAIASGWVTLATLANERLLGRIATGTDPAPTVTTSGGSAGNTVSAQIAAFRGGLPLSADLRTSFNSTTQHIAYPAWEGRTALDVLLWTGGKADDWTSAASPGTEIGEATSTLGLDQGIVWAWQQLAADGDVAAGQFTITGGTAEYSRGTTYAFTPDTVHQTGSITPAMTDVWLKSIGRPFLNRPLLACELVSDVQRPPRGGLFDVRGRSHPVAVTEVRGSRRYTLQILTDTAAEADDLDLALASGDPLYLHTPAAFPEPSMYCIVGDSSKQHARRSARCEFTLPLVEVAAPGPGIVGGTATWQTVLSTYTTWADVLAAHPTWADVLELVADPSEIIVP